MTRTRPRHWAQQSREKNYRIEHMGHPAKCNAAGHLFDTQRDGNDFGMSQRVWDMGGKYTQHLRVAQQPVGEKRFVVAAQEENEGGGFGQNLAQLFEVPETGGHLSCASKKTLFPQKNEMHWMRD